MEIEANIDEDELREMLSNGGRLRAEVTLHKKCHLILHPRSRQDACRKYSTAHSLFTLIP